MSEQYSPQNTLRLGSFEIPVMKPKLPNVSQVASYLSKMDSAGVYSNKGPLVQELEIRYSALLGIPRHQVIAVSSGTVALEAIVAAKINSSPFFSVPDYTFAATALAIEQVGAGIELVDVDSDGWIRNTSFSSDYGVSALIVAPFGETVGYEKYSRDQRGGSINDFAAALLNVIVQKLDLSESSVAFSLHATKCLGCGEGGLVIAKDEDEARFLRTYINFGFNGERISIQPGTNGKMSEITAAYALASLDYIELEVQEWRSSRELMFKIPLPHGVTHFSRRESLTPYWIVNTPDPEFRMKLERHLASKGIESRRWWPEALSNMPHFKTSKTQHNEMSSFLSQTQLGLPFFRDLQLKDADKIASAFDNFDF